MYGYGYGYGELIPANRSRENPSKRVITRIIRGIRGSTVFEVIKDYVLHYHVLHHTQAQAAIVLRICIPIKNHIPYLQATGLPTHS